MYRIFFLFVLLMLPMTAFSYSDVELGNRYYKAIRFIEGEGIIEGYDDGSFRAEKPINRAELMKILIESIFGKQLGKKPCFSDMKEGDWYIGPVCFAKQRGIIKGYPDGTFRADQPVTFIEALKMVLVSYRINYAPNGETWYANIVRRASEDNLIPLDIDSLTLELNRGQATDMLARAISFKRKMLDDYLGVHAIERVEYDDLLAEKNVYESLPDELHLDSFSTTLPILMFHYIEDIPATDPDRTRHLLSYSPEKFEDLLKFLYRNNVSTLTFHDMREILEGRRRMPEKAVILTFDDGHHNQYTEAYRLLDLYDMKGVFFIITSKPNVDDTYMDWDQLRDIAMNGHEIGGHTITHQHLTTMDAHTLQDEIVESKKILEEKLETDVITFSYPVGKYDLRVLAEVKKHYDFARTTKPGSYFSLKKRYELPTMRIFPATGEEDFKRWLGLGTSAR